MISDCSRTDERGEHQRTDQSGECAGQAGQGKGTDAGQGGSAVAFPLRPNEQPDRQRDRRRLPRRHATPPL